MWGCLCDPSFSRFSRTPTCDRQTDTDSDTGPWVVARMHSIARWKRYELSAPKLIVGPWHALDMCWFWGQKFKRQIVTLILGRDGEQRRSACRCGCAFSSLFLHRVSEKQDTKLLLITSPTINRFKTNFTPGLGSKFATNYSCLNVPSRFKHVATLTTLCNMNVRKMASVWNMYDTIWHEMLFWRALEIRHESA